jgi:hypothetical protein
MTIRVGSGSSAREEARKRGDDLPQNRRYDDRRNGDDRDGVHHRGFDLALELDGLFNVHGEPLENPVQDATSLAGSDHVGIQRVEHFRVLLHGVGQRRPGLDIRAHLKDDGGKGLVLFLAAEDFETLHQWQTRVDHDGELSGEHGKALGRYRLGAHLLRRRGPGVSGLGDSGHENLFAPQR